MKTKIILIFHQNCNYKFTHNVRFFTKNNYLLSELFSLQFSCHIQENMFLYTLKLYFVIFKNLKKIFNFKITLFI